MTRHSRPKIQRLDDSEGAAISAAALPSDVDETISAWQHARALWSGLGDGRKIIVIPANIDNADDPATGTGEARACAFITSALRMVLSPVQLEIYFPNELARSLERNPRDTEKWLGENDLILLGGMGVNQIAARAVEKLTPVDPWIGESGRELWEDRSIKDHWIRYRGGKCLRTKYSDIKQPNSATMIEDYGVFAIRPNCFSRELNPSSRIVLVYGAHTYGTQAAADLLFEFSFASWLAKRWSVKSNPRWMYQLDGCVKVTPESAGLQPTDPPIPSELAHPERRVEVIAPKKIAGFFLNNPVLPKLYAYETARMGRHSTLQRSGVSQHGESERTPPRFVLEATSTEGLVMPTKKRQFGKAVHPTKRQGSEQFASELPKLLARHRGMWAAYHGKRQIGIKASVEELTKLCEAGKKPIPMDECYFGYIDDPETPVAVKSW